MKAFHLNSEMSLLRLALAVLILIQGVFASSDDKVPPSIVEDLKQLQYFKDGENISLSCRAEGSPNLTYAWKKDGFIFISEKVSNVKLADGYLNISSANGTNEGYYQCLAKNDYGTACTNVLHLRRATLEFQDASVSFVECTRRQQCILNVSLTSVPDATYTWLAGVKEISSSKRIQIGDDGTLYFANVLIDDSSEYEETYELLARNEYSNITVKKLYDLTVIPAHEIAKITPSPICKSSVTALVGESAKLRCFFFGDPEPDITWTNPRGEKVQNTSNFDTELEIRNVFFADEGNYTCTARNGKGENNHTIKFVVDAAPNFANDSDHPYDTTVQVGDNLTFHCIVEAKPEANVTWYMDGTLLNVSKLPPRFEFSEDGKSLTILDVCLNCMDTERDIGSDMMVIQCNASNKHGYAFHNGYVKVVGRQPTSTSTSTTSTSTTSTSTTSTSTSTTSTSTSTSTSPSSSPRPVSDCNKTELTNWLILFIVGLKSLLPVH